MKLLLQFYTPSKRWCVGIKSSRQFSDLNVATATAKPDEWSSAKPYSSIPGPKALPIIGNIWRFLPFIGDLHHLDNFERNKLFYSKYGKIVRLGGLMKIPDVVMLYKPEDIEHLFRNEGAYPIRVSVSKTFVYYRKNVRPELFGGSNGIADVHGKEWYSMRSKLNPIIMHPQTVLQYVKPLNKIADQLIQKIRHQANSISNGEMPDDFNMFLFSWTLESIMYICLDKQLGSLEINSPNAAESTKLINSLTEMFQLFYEIERTPTLLNIYKSKTWKRFVELMDYIVLTYLKHMEESREKKVGDNIADSTIYQQLLKIDKKFTLAVAVDMLIGGVDTTGKVAASGLYYLAKTPKAQTRLREELCKLIPTKDAPVTKEILSEATYLRATVKEILRLAPIATGNIRQTVKDMVISGYQVPKGTDVFTSNLMLSHSEDYYNQPEKFIPERWLRSTDGKLSGKSTHPFVTLPYGFGVRSCLGKRLANLELEIGIAKVVRNFYLEWQHNDVIFKPTPFYGIVDPLKLRVVEVEQ